MFVILFHTLYCAVDFVGNGYTVDFWLFFLRIYKSALSNHITYNL